jgi:hypothetical protein
LLFLGIALAYGGAFILNGAIRQGWRDLMIREDTDARDGAV